MSQPKPETQIFVRMNPDVYGKLEKDLLARCAVTSNTTPVEAGRIIGIHEALQHIRNGYYVPKG